MHFWWPLEYQLMPPKIMSPQRNYILSTIWGSIAPSLRLLLYFLFFFKVNILGHGRISGLSHITESMIPSFAKNGNNHYIGILVDNTMLEAFHPGEVRTVTMRNENIGNVEVRQKGSSSMQ